MRPASAWAICLPSPRALVATVPSVKSREQNTDLLQRLACRQTGLLDQADDFQFIGGRVSHSPSSPSAIMFFSATAGPGLARRRLPSAPATPVPSIYSIVPPNDGSALRHGHHFEPVDFVIDHGRGHHDAYSAGSCQRTYARACGCRQRPRRHREDLIESERGWSGREAFVTMMQTADLGQGNDRSGPGRLNGSSIRCVLADRQVGP